MLFPPGPAASAQDLTEDEEAEAVDEDIVEDVNEEDDEAEVEDDENAELVSYEIDDAKLVIGILIRRKTDSSHRPVCSQTQIPIIHQQ